MHTMHKLNSPKLFEVKQTRQENITPFRFCGFEKTPLHNQWLFCNKKNKVPQFIYNVGKQYSNKNVGRNQEKRPFINHIQAQSLIYSLGLNPSCCGL